VVVLEAFGGRRLEAALNSEGAVEPAISEVTHRDRRTMFVAPMATESIEAEGVPGSRVAASPSRSMCAGKEAFFSAQ